MVINENLTSYILTQIDIIKNIIVKEVNLKTAEDNMEVEKPLGKILVDMKAVAEDDVDEALALQSRPLGEILKDEGKIDNDSLNQALKIQKEISEKAGAGKTSIVKKEIRVSTDKLDKLFDLVGEIITSQAMVIHHPDISDIQSETFTRSRNYLEKMTRELQETTMAMRMIPLDGLFNKMFRLVRDLSKKSDKKVDLKLSGAETEMDKNVINEISDPLIHIIRNSVDHGIESKQDRIDSGKNEVASVVLSAQYVGNEIWITVTDDGKGLDRDKIIAKALSNNLIQKDPELLTDEEVWQLIFMPGFSTADTITNISGRGVGMDVVKKNIEKIRGKIEILTEKGKGTTMILKIPLTMAIIDAIITKQGKSLYAIPTLEILEFIKAEQTLVHHTDGGYIVKIRDENIPIVKMSQVYGKEKCDGDFSNGTIIILINNNRKLGVLIDEIVSAQQIVIKSLSDYFNDVKAVAGCAILSNGDVALITDTGQLVNNVLSN